MKFIGKLENEREGEMQNIVNYSKVLRCLYLSIFLFVILVIFLQIPVFSQTQNSGKNLDKITISLKWYHQFQFAGYYAAISQGFYAEEGLDVRLTTPEKGALPVESVVKGISEYGISSADLIKSRVAGMPIVVVAVIFQHSPIILLSRSDRNLRYLSDYVGKTIMASDDDLPEIKAMFVKEGIDPDFIHFIPHTWTIEPLISGTADASVDYLTNEPNLLRISGVEPYIIQPIDYGIDFYGDAIFTTEQEIKTNPDRVNAVKMATLKGWEYALEHIDEMIEQILTMPGVTERGVTREHLRYEAEQIIKLVQPKLVELGHINPARWERMGKAYAQFGGIKKDFSLDGFIYSPQEDHFRYLKLLYVSFGLIGFITLIAIMILFWNRQLRAAVKRRTLELKNNQSYLQSIFDACPDAIFIHDAETGEILDINQSMCKMFKCSRDQALELDVGKLSQGKWPYTQQAALEWLKKAGKNGSQSFQWLSKRLDSTLFWLEVNINFFTLSDGSKRFLVLARDITERKITEDTLFQVIEKNPMSIQIVDKNGFTLKVNPSHTSLFGAIPPLSYTVFDDQQLKNFGHDGLMGLAREGNAVVFPDFTYNAHHVNPDFPDQPIWIKMIVFPLIDMNGEPYQYVLMHENITERKLAENALRNSEENLRTTLSSIGDAVIATDAKGAVARMNPIAEQLTGWLFTEAKGKNLKDVFHIVSADTRQFLEDPSEKVLATGEMVGLANHTMLISRSGLEYQIADSGAPIRDDSGKITGVVLVFRDVTEEYALQKQIWQSQKMEAIGQLAGGIAHDFNNLLGGIFGYIDLAYYANKDAKVKEYLEQTRNTLNRARGLTHHLLTFSKGGTPVKTTDHLFPFVEENARFALSGSNILCRLEISDNLLPCSYDKNLLGQVIDNIVINAKQAMPMGGDIVISAKNVSISERNYLNLPEGSYVKLSIKDSGIGIPKELHSRIFDPFFTTKSTGHGLGLATCYSIIKQHNGSIEIESEPGNGSTFHVWLPASTEIVPLDEIKSADFHEGSGTILVMDDEIVMRKTIGEMLQSFGYNVVCKENGREAINYFQEALKAERRLTAMVFDLTIPGGMGGKEAVREIRKLSADIPVFVASGYADDPVMANPKEYGFTASIRKPFMIDGLAKMLNSFLK